MLSFTLAYKALRIWRTISHSSCFLGTPDKSACKHVYIYVLANMCKASDTCCMGDVSSKCHKNWRQERSPKTWIHPASNTCARKVCKHIANVATFALFFSALCTVSLLSRPSKTVLLMSASRSRGARSVELQICLRKAQSFHSFCDTSYSSLAGDCWCFPKMKKS